MITITYLRPFFFLRLHTTWMPKAGIGEAAAVMDATTTFQATYGAQWRYPKGSFFFFLQMEEENHNINFLHFI